MYGNLKPLVWQSETPSVCNASPLIIVTKAGYLDVFNLRSESYGQGGIFTR